MQFLFNKNQRTNNSSKHPVDMNKMLITLVCFRPQNVWLGAVDCIVYVKKKDHEECRENADLEMVKLRVVFFFQKIVVFGFTGNCGKLWFF
jgi:hypothetical protein